MSDTPTNDFGDHGTVDTAILFAGWGDAPLGVPGELMPLLDRPMLQWVVEQLVRAGCINIHVVLGRHPLPIKAFLGDGARWGCRLSYHHPQADERLGQIMHRLELVRERRYALVDAAYLPVGCDVLLPRSLPVVAMGCAHVWKQDGVAHWGGWGLFEGAWLLEQDIDADHTKLESHLLRSDRIEKRQMPEPLSAATPAALLASSRRLLDDLPDGASAGRNSYIDHSATILPPVYIGRHVRIGANAIIGPDVVIADGAYIDRDAHLKNAVVLANTYVGEELELHDSLANGHLLANIRLNTVVEVADSNLLCTLPRSHLDAAAPSIKERVLATTLRAALSPLRALAHLQCKCAAEAMHIRSCGKATQPRAGQGEPVEIRVDIASPRLVQTAARSQALCHFRHTFYPGLKEVAHGRMRLVGPTPRSLVEIRQLHEAWQALYGEHRCGLLNESLLEDPVALSSELEFAGDALACANQGKAWASLKLLWRYLGRVVRDLFMKPETPELAVRKMSSNDVSKTISIRQRHF